jgi:PIN domain nuclease of toxin-antitoxin system
VKKVLLDTHVLLWWLANHPKLGKKAHQIIVDERNEVYVSAVSVWEIAIKKNKGLLKAPDDIDTIVEDEGFSKLPISLFHGEQAGNLPIIHRDPFDRMLIAQAQAEGMELMTADKTIAEYGLRVIDARL